MTLLGTLAAGAVAIGLSLQTPAHTGPDPRPILLVCDAAKTDALCDALSDALSQISNGATVVTDPPDDGDVRLTVRFVLTRQGASMLAGRLVWTSGSTRASGPELELSAVDTELRGEMLRAFAAALLIHSGVHL